MPEAIHYQTYWDMATLRHVLTLPHPGGKDTSQSPGLWSDGTWSWEHMVDSLDNPAVAYAETITRIDQLSQQLTIDALPYVQDQRRQRTTGRMGYALNPHAVLRGNLAHAWKTTQRTPTHGRSTVVTLVLPGRYAANVSATRIEWQMCANIALADALERKGIRVELWCVTLGRDTFEHAHAYTAIRLKMPQTPWNIQDVIPLTQSGFFRRVTFRVWEQDAAKHGGIGYAYGFGWHREDLRQRLEAWAHQLELGALVIGASEDSPVHNYATALAWLKNTVQTVQQGDH